MRLRTTDIALLACALFRLTTAAPESTPKVLPPCTAHSTATGNFYDLRSIALGTEESKKVSKPAKTESWHARGYDYGSNFTLNVCEPVLEDIKDVVGVKEELWRNVSAYYEAEDKIYSLGQQSSEPVMRGRRLIIEYTNGSPCKSDHANSGKDDVADVNHRKSTIVSFLCERDPLSPLATASFVGVSPDECAYFFEVRSEAACKTAEPAEQGVGPAGVFGIIVLIAILVYFIGGIFYSRNVSHQRGWRQLPNYSFWAGIGGFIYVSLGRLSFMGRRVGKPRSIGVRDGLLPTARSRLGGNSYTSFGKSSGSSMRKSTDRASW